MLHAKFQAPEVNGSEEQDFWKFLMDFYGQIQNPLVAAILKSETFSGTNLKKDNQDMLQTKFYAYEKFERRRYF